MPTPKIESPCKKVCMVSGQTGQCLGCGRTLREIGGWVQLGEAGRRAVMAELPERMKRLQAREQAG